MRANNPEEIKSFEVIPPILGKSKDFGKVRVTLTNPKYNIDV